MFCISPGIMIIITTLTFRLCDADFSVCVCVVSLTAACVKDQGRCHDDRSRWQPRLRDRCPESSLFCSSSLTRSRCVNTHTFPFKKKKKRFLFFFIFRPQLKEMGRPGPFPVGGKDVTWRFFFFFSLVSLCLFCSRVCKIWQCFFFDRFQVCH